MAVSPREIGSREEFLGVILAVDYGRKRLGLALSDELGVLSRPFAVWNRTNRRRDLARLRDLVREHAVRRIVVGLPLHADGRESEMSQEARAFAARVQKALGLPVEMIDERLSSWEAQQLGGSGKRGTKAQESKMAHRGAPVDDRAAAVILRDYLERPEMARKIEVTPPSGESSRRNIQAPTSSAASANQARK